MKYISFQTYIKRILYRDSSNINKVYDLFSCSNSIDFFFHFPVFEISIRSINQYFQFKQAQFFPIEVLKRVKAIKYKSAQLRVITIVQQLSERIRQLNLDSE